MASKKFHITPDGPKKCTATFRLCKYASHYESEESAQAAVRLIANQKAHEEKSKNLQKVLHDHTPPNFNRSSFMFHKGSDSARRWAEELEFKKRQFGQDPRTFHALGVFRLNQGSGDDVRIDIMRMDSLDEENEKFVGVWRVKTEYILEASLRKDKIVQEVTLDFSDDVAYKRSLIQLNEVFRNGAIISGIRDDDDADAKASEMLKSFEAMYTAVESESDSEFALWEKGTGYFKDSYSEDVIVDVDFNTTAFRGENFKRFMKDNLYYARYSPNVEIKVTDSNPHLGTSWSLYRKEEQWSMILVDKNGTSSDMFTRDADDVYSRVYWAVKDEVNPDNKEEALRKAKYAMKLFTEVEEAIEENKKSVAAGMEEDRIATEKRKAMIAAGIVPGRKTKEQIAEDKLMANLDSTITRTEDIARKDRYSKLNK